MQSMFKANRKQVLGPRPKGLTMPLVSQGIGHFHAGKRGGKVGLVQNLDILKSYK